MSANDNDQRQLSDADVDRLVERFLVKLAERLARGAANEAPSPPPAEKELPRHLRFRRTPPPEAYVNVMNRMRRNGEL